jgi:hypothetical protein
MTRRGACPAAVEATLAREDKMLEGSMVLVVALGTLAVLWAIVLYGSTYFGPKTD